ncbi:putative FMN-dependent luciferase-like monooxygenase [Microvirga rosea]|uniref:putative FMN-dependent luciferase-like monooxygenase n=1 Tax=Microvirga rosea TaxID=2715425 RepID=UPI001D0BD596|nr:putative FMN-dependent luciferase-like monooxygenase [Microvirga rosea]MCB8821228.1 putative FMN-dependent luciferase-like monooxygenase [Microvirga rosea]
MTKGPQTKRLGFFTRLLDETSAGERYRLASEQILHAEQYGFDSAWVAQHHFHEAEGGLPAPLVFLSHVAARTSRIRLGTGIITLPLENPVRVAEDAAVLDLLSGGRLEIGVGTGGTPSSFTAFGLDSANRSEIYERHLATVRGAWKGETLEGGETLYPTAASLNERIWQATFSVWGGTRAGKAGDGLMLSRTQPRPAEKPHASLDEIQHPIIDAYLDALPNGREPRIVASRTLFVADKRDEALHLAEQGLRRVVNQFAAKGHVIPGNSLQEIMAALDTHAGTPDDVISSLRADTTLPRVTDLVFQVHSVDPPHSAILRSIELIATEVAPALGWQPQDIQPQKRVALVR